MNKMTKYTFIVIALFLALSQWSCVDEPKSEDVKSISFYLTDCPFEAEEVNVEILGISVEDEDGTTINLNTQTGVYNLLEFQNNVDTLFASGNVDLDNIENVYFTLGEDNTIVVDGETFPLELHNGNNVVKVKMDLDNVEDNDEYVLDFYACTSIVKMGDTYKLKPVIKFKGEKGEDYDDFIEDIVDDLEDCYDLEYPISFFDEDGNVIEANNQDELIDVFSSGEAVAINYPFSVVNAEGVSTEIQSEADLDQLEDCDDEDEELEENDEIEEFLEDVEECNDILYPITIINTDSIQIVVTDSTNLSMFLESDMEVYSLEFPIDFMDDEGNINTINSTDDLEDLDLDCDDDDDDDENLGLGILLSDLRQCYNYIYPLNLIDSLGSVISVNDDTDLTEAIENNTIVDAEFPFEIEDEQGEIIIVNSKGHVNGLVQSCENDDDENELEDLIDDLEDCYSILFPIDVNDMDGNLLSIQNQDELEDALEDNLLTGLVYPINLEDEDGNVVSVSSEEELLGLIDECD